jgi:hypothetical protein
MLSGVDTSTIDKEYFELEDRFEQEFGYRIPRAMFPDRILDEDVKKAMRVCFERNEDVLYSVLGISIDEK